VSDFVLIYELKRSVKSPQSEFIKQAKLVGWTSSIWLPIHKKWGQLPRGMLIGDFPSPAEAGRALSNAVAETKKSVPVALTKYFLAPYVSPISSSDELTEVKPDK
jgi:hypothetical protein